MPLVGHSRRFRDATAMSALPLMTGIAQRPRAGHRLPSSCRRRSANTVNSHADGGAIVHPNPAGKVKFHLRLQGSMRLLSSGHDRQDRLRRLSWNGRPHVAPRDDAGRWIAGSRQAQGLGAHAPWKIAASFGCRSRRGRQGLLPVSTRPQLKLSISF